MGYESFAHTHHAGLNTNGHWYLWITNHIAHTHHAGCGAPYMEARAAAVGDPGVPGAVYFGLYKHIVFVLPLQIP